MTKWIKIDPADISLGDKVRQVTTTPDYRQVVTGVVTYMNSDEIDFGGASLMPSIGTWYIRKPKKAKPLTRPEEPPVGSLFRINDSPKAWLRVDGFESSYVLISESDESLWGTWDYITEPGDTITMLKLVEDKPNTSGDFPG